MEFRAVASLVLPYASLESNVYDTLIPRTPLPQPGGTITNPVYGCLEEVTAYTYAFLVKGTWEVNSSRISANH